jgi:hypothetical protein
MSEQLTEVINREIARFDAISRERPLTSAEIKDLETLTRALKAFKAPDKKADNPLDGLTSEELLQLIRG